MNFKTLLTINAVLAVVSGIIFILIPGQILASYGIRLSLMGEVIYQFWGATLIGLGLLTWSVRPLEAPEFKKRIALYLSAINGLSCLLALRGQTAGANALGWSTVVVYMLMAAGFGYFYIKTAKGKVLCKTE